MPLYAFAAQSKLIRGRIMICSAVCPAVAVAGNLAYRAHPDAGIAGFRI
jgi:hypothetical protein